ncbi:MAG: hypothetical protein ACQETL_20115 [Bacteroidota bacterium]
MIKEYIIIGVIILVLIIIVRSVKIVPKNHSPNQSPSKEKWTYDDYNKMAESLISKKLYYGMGLLNFIVNGDRRNDIRIIYIYERIAESYVDQDEEIESFLQKEIPNKQIANKTYKNIILEIYGDGQKRIAQKICEKVASKYF